MEQDQDFDSGFEGTPTETPAAPTEPVVEAPKLAQLTEEQLQQLMERSAQLDELKASHDKLQDRVFGKVGGLERQLKEFQQQGRAMPITAEDFAELRAEFPELADLTMKGLERALSKMGQQRDPGNMPVTANDQVETLRQQMIRANLDNVLDGWDAEVKKPEFAEWLNGQGKDVQALQHSDDIRDAARMLRLYRESRTPPAKDNSRQRRLQASVTPKGDGGAPAGPSEEDDFLAGFSGR